MSIKGVVGKPMNIGYTAPKNGVHNALVALAFGRGKKQRNSQKVDVALLSAIHIVLNVPHKARWHAITSELTQICIGMCLQQLHQQT